MEELNKVMGETKRELVIWKVELITLQRKKLRDKVIKHTIEKLGMRLRMKDVIYI